ncbi:MAG TPA: hypothetical protein VFT22_09670 [Kofleriaceae bacterium]|nr:hypothetical protein [Kofleriaceae bacterium]
MDDRMDIDALLMGALYGELSPAEEARLSAHLESHPADRTALADLTRTREAVRESRILSVQHEPPQSVSALLLQEAARRAPRARADRAEAAGGDGWFQRLLRTLMAHPAVAVATTFVLVAGVAGTLHLRGRDRFAEPAVPEPSGTMASAPAAAPPPPAPSTGSVAADDGAAPPAGGRGAGLAGAAAPQPDGSGSGYQVRLDEAERGPGAVQKQITRLEEQRAAKAAEVAPPAAMSKAKASRGIEVRAPQPEPKDLDDAPAKGFAHGGADRDVASDRERAPARAAPSTASGGGAAAAPRAAAGTGDGAALASEPAAPEPAPPPAIAQAAPGARSKFAQPAKPSPRPVAAQAQPAQPAPPPASNAPKAARGDQLADKSRASDAKAEATSKAPVDARPEEKSSEDKALLGWAQRQREQVIAYVRSNNCRAAASTATEIYNRAPGYYAANITTDRAIKPCLAYLDSDREREERSRASERSREERSKASKRAAPAVDIAPDPATRK